MVGYTMIVYGLVDAVASYGFAPLVKLFGRIPIFTLAATLNILITIVFSTVSAGGMTIPFIVVAVWGTADAVWQTQINGEF